MTYLTTCPICGQQLQSVDLDPDTAPYLCRTCHRGYWVAELAHRERWRPAHRDFGHGNFPERDAECEASRQRKP